MIIPFLCFCFISLHCCFVSHAVYLVDPHLVFSTGECCTFDILHENELVDRKTLWLLSLCSCLSPWAKMPVTDRDTVWILSGQQSQTSGPDFVTFCDIFVRHPRLFLPAPFCVLKGRHYIKSQISILFFK